MFGNTNQQGGWLTREDLGPGLINFGLSVLANNNGRMNDAQLIGQGGLDALSNLHARKQYEQAMARQQMLDERAQAQHDMQMQKGQFEMAEAKKKAELMKRWQAGDMEAYKILFPEQWAADQREMMRHKNAMARDEAERKAKEAEAKKKAEEEAAFYKSIGILPGTLPVNTTPAPASTSAPSSEAPVAPAASAEKTAPQPSLASPSRPGDSSAPINPYEGYDMEKVRQVAISGGPNAKRAEQILEGYNKYLKDQQKWQESEVKRKENVEKQQKQQRDSELKAGAAMDALSSAKRILSESDKGWGVTGMDGLALGYAAGSPAFDLRQHVATLKNNLGLHELQEMRKNAPNGSSGLGQVTEREHAILQNALAALNPNMSFEEFSRNLSIVETILGDVVNGTSNAIIRDSDGQFIGIRNEYDLSHGYESGSRNAPDEWASFYD